MTTLAMLSQTIPASLDRVHADYKAVATQAVERVNAGEPGAPIQVDGVRMSAEEITLQVTLDGYIDPTA